MVGESAESSVESRLLAHEAALREAAEVATALERARCLRIVEESLDAWADHPKARWALRAVQQQMEQG